MSAMKEHLMNEYLSPKPMRGALLIACLAGELEIDPALLVETIKEDTDLLHVVRSYGKGDLTYEQVLDTIKSGDYF